MNTILLNNNSQNITNTNDGTNINDDIGTKECFINIETNNNDIIIDKECRICFETNNSNTLISPCLCDGSSKYIHKNCLYEWMTKTTSDDAKIRCMECNFVYKYETSYIQNILIINTILNYRYNLYIIFSILNIIYGYLLYLINNKKNILINIPNNNNIYSNYYFCGCLLQLIIFIISISIVYIKYNLQIKINRSNIIKNIFFITVTYLILYLNYNIYITIILPAIMCYITTNTLLKIKLEKYKYIKEI